MSNVIGRVRAILAWGNSRRLTRFVDLGIKSAALIVALLAANFFREPHIVFVGSPHSQAFVDVGALEHDYEDAGHSLPDMVRDTAREYDRVNELDLLNGTNSSAALHPPAEICDRFPGWVEQLFPDANCAADPPYLGGRGRTYERLLLVFDRAAGNAVDVAGLREGMQRMHDAEFVAARYRVENDGHGYATDVQVLAPEGFTPSAQQPFSLAPGHAYGVRFETGRGTFEHDPSQDLLLTDVSWGKGVGVLTGGLAPAVIIVLIVGLVWAIVSELIQPDEGSDEA